MSNGVDRVNEDRQRPLVGALEEGDEPLVVEGHTLHVGRRRTMAATSSLKIRQRPRASSGSAQYTMGGPNEST